MTLGAWSCVAYDPSQADELWQLLVDTVHRINVKDYTPQQINAWVPKDVDKAAWRARLAKSRPMVVMDNQRAVGFVELLSDGLIDCFYVHYQYQNMGIGSTMLEWVMNEAKRVGLSSVYAEVSITARSFFLAHDFFVEKENHKHHQGERFINYSMRCRCN